MNERISEIWDQAAKANALLRSGENSWETQKAFIEKFAELIIKECAKFCEHESNDDEHDEYDLGMWVKAESIKTAIVEHFGVK